MTAIATARTTNWTNRMISRVNRKNSATIPTIPRKSGPKRPCRYDTRPLVLSARGAAISEWNIGLLRSEGDFVLAADRANSRGAGSRLAPGLGRRGDAAHVPGPVLPHNCERISHLEPGRRLPCLAPRRWLPGDTPHDGSNNIADGPAGRHCDRRERAEGDRAAQAGHRGSRLEEPAERVLVPAGVSLEEVGKLRRQRRLGG